MVEIDALHKKKTIRARQNYIKNKTLLPVLLKSDNSLNVLNHFSENNANRQSRHLTELWG